MARTNKDKPRVLIGSSVEGLRLAQALQEQLQYDCRPTVWTEDVFKLSQTAIHSLLARLDKSDFAILVVTPDDVQRLRGQRFVTGRDNVLLEFALAVGRLGQDRAFMVVPQNVPKLHIPTDLLGIEAARYDWSPDETEWLSVLGPVASRIRREIAATMKRRPTVRSWGYFGDFAGDFASHIENAREIALYFIHSRRWREMHLDSLDRALSGDCRSIDVYLPNVANALLRDSIAAHFDDGPFVAGLVLEGYDYWRRLEVRYPGKIRVRLFELHPTYSFYRFDSDVVVALYPNSARKKDVPTFVIDTSSPYWSFIADDLYELDKRNPLGLADLEALITRRTA